MSDLRLKASHLHSKKQRRRKRGRKKYTDILLRDRDVAVGAEFFFVQFRKS